MPLSDNAARRKDEWGANFRDFQHRHYAGMAGIIRSIDDLHVRGFAARRFAEALGRNRNFNRRRFMEAALGTEERDDAANVYRAEGEEQ